MGARGRLERWAVAGVIALGHLAEPGIVHHEAIDEGHVHPVDRVAGVAQIACASGAPHDARQVLW